MIENAIREILLQDTEVTEQVADRVIPIDRTLDDEIPAITYTSEEPPFLRRLDGGAARIVKQDIEFDIWHNSYDEAKSLARRISKVLSNFSGPKSNFFIHLIRCGGAGEDKEKSVGVVSISAHVIYTPPEET
ncbi:MAG: hypothetical protein JJU10_05465 [Idiomarina sp.]|nr:hypothetical protein [Idiomarina sp.]